MILQWKLLKLNELAWFSSFISESEQFFSWSPRWFGPNPVSLAWSSSSWFVNDCDISLMKMHAHWRYYSNVKYHCWKYLYSIKLLWPIFNSHHRYYYICKFYKSLLFYHLKSTMDIQLVHTSERSNIGKTQR